MIHTKKIKKIVKQGIEKTYDLEVEGNHNFFLSNGVLSHNSEDMLLIVEMNSQRSVETTLEPLKKDRRITDTMITYIKWKIKIHEACIIERRQKAKILKRINPPRCRYWKSSYGDFMSLWKKEVNSWVRTEKFYDIYDEENNESRVMDELSKKENPTQENIQEDKNDKSHDEVTISVRSEVSPEVRIPKQVKGKFVPILSTEEDDFNFEELSEEETLKEETIIVKKEKEVKPSGKFKFKF